MKSTNVAKKTIKYFNIVIFCVVSAFAFAGESKPKGEEAARKKQEDTTTAAGIPVDLSTRCYAATTAAIECICTNTPLTEEECFGCGGKWVSDPYTLHCR